MSFAPFGRRMPLTDYEKAHRRRRDLVGRIETSATGNTILEIGREIDGEGRWTKTAHVVLTPQEAWYFAAEVADKQPPEEVAKLARQVVEMWRAGSGAYDAEEVEAAIAALADALPPKFEPPVQGPHDPF